MLSKLLISQYRVSDNPRNFYQQILPQKLSTNSTPKIWHDGTPNHLPEEPQKSAKNGDISLTRPGQKKGKHLNRRKNHSMAKV